MAKAVQYTSRAQELMGKAHHECFSSMQKLLVNARADKIIANEARRRSRASNDDSSRVHTPPAAGSPQFIDPCPPPRADDLHFADNDSPVDASPPHIHEFSSNNCQSTPLLNADAEETVNSGNSMPPTPSALHGPYHGVDSICSLLASSSVVDYFSDEV